MFGYAGVLRQLFGTIDVSQGIVGFCAILYLLSLTVDVQGIRMGGGLFGILSPSGKALYQLGMTADWRPWYTVLPATFLHGNLLHIFFNMMWTRNMGPVVEEFLGPARFLLLFCISGASGFILSNVLSGVPTIGASGAVFGLLGAGIVLGRHRGGTTGDALRQQALMYSVVLLVFGFMMPQVNNWAHIGGFAGGFVTARAMTKHMGRPEGPLVQVAAAAVVVLTLVGIVLSFISVSSMLLQSR